MAHDGIWNEEQSQVCKNRRTLWLIETAASVRACPYRSSCTTDTTLAAAGGKCCYCCPKRKNKNKLNSNTHIRNTGGSTCFNWLNMFLQNVQYFRIPENQRKH